MYTMALWCSLIFLLLARLTFCQNFIGEIGTGRVMNVSQKSCSTFFFGLILLKSKITFQNLEKKFFRTYADFSRYKNQVANF